MQWRTGVVLVVVLAGLASACSSSERPTLAGGDQEVVGPSADVGATTTPTPTEGPEPGPEATPTPASAAPEGGWLSVFEHCDDVERLGDVPISDEELDERMRKVGDAIASGLASSGGAWGIWGRSSLDLWSFDESTLALVSELFEPRDVCVEGPEPGGPPLLAEPGFRMVSLSSDLDEGEIVAFADAGSLQGSLGDGVDVDWVDFDRSVVVAFGLGTSACRPIVTDLSTNGSAVQILVGDPGYASCDTPALVPTYVLSIDYARLPPGVASIVHPDGRSVVDVQVPDGPFPPVQEVAPDPVTEERGRLPLPVPGATVAARLDDGTPVFVVRHETGGVTVVDPRAPYRSGNAPALRLVEFATLSRRFMGIGTTQGYGAWDE